MKILIVTKNWLGDILFEVPAMEMLRARYPEAEILCMTHPRCYGMLEQQPAIDRILEFDERGKQASLWAKFQWVLRLRQEKIDEVYFFHRSRTRAFLTKLAGIKVRCGYSVKKPNFLTKAVPEPSGKVHHVDYFVNLLEACGIPKIENLNYRFYFSQRDQAEVERLLQARGLSRFACFHLGANWEPKRWPAAHFARLADLLWETWQLPVILTGGPADTALGEEVLHTVKKGQAVSLIGETSLTELGALFSRAAFVVSGDSGPMHIASGSGARVAAIFGPTHPDLTGPRGTGDTLVFHHVPPGYQSPWYEERFPEEGWLSQIKPESVLEGIRSKGWHEAFHGKSANGKKSKKGRKDLRRVLINTLSNIGDVILTTPVIMSLVKQFPNHPLTVIAGPRAKGILEGSQFIDKVVVYDKHASLAKKLEFLKEIRRDRYEVAVDLKNSAIPFLVSARKRSPLFRFFRESQARKKHLEVLKWMGLESPESIPFDFYGESETLSVAGKLENKGITGSQDWIVLVPVAADEKKSWPVASYGKFIKGLLQETGLAVILAGASSEREKLQPLTEIDPKRVINLAGETSLRELAALIGNSECLIANDSSAAQLGFEMNHPSVVLFGPTDPETFGRKGENFRILREAGMKIDPEKVLGACLELLAARTAKIS